MEKLMNAYEEVSGGGVKDPFQAQLDQLVNPVRTFLQSEELEVKQAPFSSSAKVAARLYLFNDLLVVAVPSGSGTPKSLGSMLAAEDAPGGKARTLKRYRGVYKVHTLLDLHRCSVKLASASVLQVTFVTRETDRESAKKGTIKILTRVEKIELWMAPEHASRLYTQLTMLIDELIEADLRRLSVSSDGRSESLADVGSAGGDSRHSVSHSEGGEGGGEGGDKTRGWAARKNTLKRNGTLKSASGGSSAARLSARQSRKGLGGALGDEGGASVGGLSLSDIESRYQLNLDAPALPNGSVEFYVEYNEGVMGFSLSSSANVGVIVGRVAEGSFSDDAGVCIGDRVVEVGESAIGIDTSWQAVVDTIKVRPRPLRVKFERLAGRVKDKEDLTDKEEGSPAPAASGGRGASPDASGPASPSSGPTSPASDRKRAWAKKRQQRAHATEGDDQRLISLVEMERLYKSGRKVESEDTSDRLNAFFVLLKASDAAEAKQQAASVLKEIWTSERTYVLDLRTLVREFILPLRRKVKRVRCKDAEGSRICDHGLPRSQCSKISAKAEALLSNADMLTIFNNIETLVKINTELLNHIEAELGKMATRRDCSVLDVAQVFGPAFEKVMPYFKLYGVYCHGYSQGIDRLLVCRTANKELDEVLKDRERKAHVSLGSLLIKPVQRVCKYPLLFRELLKHTSQLQVSEAERGRIAGLQHASEVAEKIAQSVDQYVENEESSDTLVDVFNELGGDQAVSWLITPHRKFVTKVNVLMHEAPYAKEPALVVMYVCTDLVIFGTGKQLEGFGVGQKTGGKKGLGASLMRSAGSSLKRSLRHSFGKASPSLTHHLSGHGSGRVKGTVKLLRKIDLVSLTPTMLSEKDDAGCSGIELKCVERVEDDKHPGKTVTNINKIKIWLPTQEEQHAVYDDIEENLVQLKERQEGHKKAQATMGSPQAARSWKSGAAAAAVSDLAFPATTASRHESLRMLRMLTNDK